MAAKNGSDVATAAVPQKPAVGTEQRVKVTCRGITPMLMNSMPVEVLLGLRDKNRKSPVAQKPTIEEEAATKLYLSANGKPCVPGRVLYAALVGAGRFIKYSGKKQISTKTDTILPALMTLDGAEFELDCGDKEKPWEVDIQQGKNPNGGEAVCLVRPRFDDWKLVCEITIDTTEVAVSVIRDLFDKAGRRLGLGDFRPQKRGTFGQFVVDDWEFLN